MHKVTPIVTRSDVDDALSFLDTADEHEEVEVLTDHMGPSIGTLSLGDFLVSNRGQKKREKKQKADDFVILNAPTSEAVSPESFPEPEALEPASDSTSFRLFDLSENGRLLQLQRSVEPGKSVVNSTASDVFRYMLTWLTPVELARCASVCTRWQAEVATSPAVWRTVIAQRGSHQWRLKTAPVGLDLLERKTGSDWARYYGFWYAEHMSRRTGEANARYLRLRDPSGHTEAREAQLSPDGKRILSLHPHTRTVAVWLVSSILSSRQRTCDQPVQRFVHPSHINSMAVDWRLGRLVTWSSSWLCVWRIDCSEEKQESTTPLWSTKLTLLRLPVHVSLAEVQGVPCLQLGFAAGHLLLLHLDTGVLLRAYWLDKDNLLEGHELLSAGERRFSKLQQKASETSTNSATTVTGQTTAETGTHDDPTADCRATAQEKQERQSATPIEQKSGALADLGLKLKQSPIGLKPALFDSYGRKIARAQQAAIQVLDLTTNTLSKPFSNAQSPVRQIRLFQQGVVCMHEDNVVTLRYFDGRLVSLPPAVTGSQSITNATLRTYAPPGALHLSTDLGLLAYAQVADARRPQGVALKVVDLNNLTDTEGIVMHLADMPVMIKMDRDNLWSINSKGVIECRRWPEPNSWHLPAIVKAGEGTSSPFMDVHGSRLLCGTRYGQSRLQLMDLFDPKRISFTDSSSDDHHRPKEPRRVGTQLILQQPALEAKDRNSNRTRQPTYMSSVERDELAKQIAAQEHAEKVQRQREKKAKRKGLQAIRM